MSPVCAACSASAAIRTGLFVAQAGWCDPLDQSLMERHMAFESAISGPYEISLFAPSHIGTDPAAHLPAGAADRFRTLKQHVADLQR
jgi:hypothetical protein